jgi:hypothetical protein
MMRFVEASDHKHGHLNRELKVYGRVRFRSPAPAFQRLVGRFPTLKPIVCQKHLQDLTD